MKKWYPPWSILFSGPSVTSDLCGREVEREKHLSGELSLLPSVLSGAYKMLLMNCPWGHHHYLPFILNALKNWFCFFNPRPWRKWDILSNCEICCPGNERQKAVRQDYGIRGLSEDRRPGLGVEPILGSQLPMCLQVLRAQCPPKPRRSGE